MQLDKFEIFQHLIQKEAEGNNGAVVLISVRRLADILSVIDPIHDSWDDKLSPDDNVAAYLKS